jgi:hypothetical protein
VTQEIVIEKSNKELMYPKVVEKKALNVEVPASGLGLFD